jgi:hypothetical protein
VSYYISSFPHMICLQKIPNSVSCTHCTRSLYSVSVNFLCFSYIFLEIYGRSVLCTWVMLGYSFPTLLYVLPIWIVTKDGTSQCIPLCLTTRDEMMPFCFFLKPLLFTKFLLFSIVMIYRFSWSFFCSFSTASVTLIVCSVLHFSGFLPLSAFMHSFAQVTK